MNIRQYDDFVIGYTGRFITTITEEKNKEFADLVGDYNPVHFDEERMSRTRWGKRIANAFLTESTIGSALVKMFVSDKSLVVALEKKIRLVAPVFIGDSIEAVVTVIDRFPAKNRLLCEAVVKKQDDTRVVEASFLVKVLEI